MSVFILHCMVQNLHAELTMNWKLNIILYIQHTFARSFIEYFCCDVTKQSSEWNIFF